ncbi:MAG: four helix bundle protein [Clostridia bacterium]
MDLSIAVVGYYKWLVSEKKEYVMSKQILRSGTSIGANIHEAYYAVSKPDFIAKMQIALKECSETEYWITILEATGYYDKQFDTIKTKNNSIKRMLIATLNTSKKSGAKNE